MSHAHWWFSLTWILLPVVYCDADGLQADLLAFYEQVGQVGPAHVVAKNPGVSRNKLISLKLVNFPLSPPVESDECAYEWPLVHLDHS